VKGGLWRQLASDIPEWQSNLHVCKVKAPQNPQALECPQERLRALGNTRADEAAKTAVKLHTLTETRSQDASRLSALHGYVLLYMARMLSALPCTRDVFPHRDDFEAVIETPAVTTSLPGPDADMTKDSSDTEDDLPTHRWREIQGIWRCARCWHPSSRFSRKSAPCGLMPKQLVKIATTIAREMGHSIVASRTASNRWCLWCTTCAAWTSSRESQALTQKCLGVHRLQQSGQARTVNKAVGKFQHPVTAEPLYSPWSLT